MTNCVGFNTPIDFKPGSIYDWLETAQSATKKVLNLYSNNFHMDDFGITETNEARVRSGREMDLQNFVLPQLDLNFLAVSQIELVLHGHVFVTNLNATNPQSRGSCTEQTP